MSPDRWREVERIYHAALERENASRAAFLSEECAGDEVLRQEVQSLLDFDLGDDAFLERPALEEEAKDLAEALEESVLAERSIGGYQILSLVGTGGMGEVYRARDLKLGREVALKVLARVPAGGLTDVRRFEEEARLASGLNHPNIVTIYGVGEEDETAYIAMELVAGRTLRELLTHKPMPVTAALDLAVQLADALAAAHASGIAHRDLKPENLMVTPEGLLKVLDFGIAKLLGAANRPLEAAGSPHTQGAQTPWTEPGMILGTVGYMSPEQAAARPTGHTSDQFSFGAILYELLSGERAFRRNTRVQTLNAIIREQPEPIQNLNAEVGIALRDVLARCLAKNPADRYSDTRDLAVAMRRIRDQRKRDDAARIGCRLTWGEREVPLEEGENILGRDPAARGSIPDASISRRHARITVRGDAATLEDLASKNGTFVGEERVTKPTPLSNGDVVRFGLVRFVFRSALGGSTTTETV